MCLLNLFSVVKSSCSLDFEKQFIIGGLPGFFSVSLSSMFSDAYIGAVSLALIVSTFPEGENINYK